jgi:hypothetical protein
VAELQAETVAPAAPAAQSRVTVARAAETVRRESTRLSRALMVGTAADPALVDVVVTVAPADALRVRALPVSAVLPVPVARWATPVTVVVAPTAMRERPMADAAATAVQVVAPALQAMVAPAETAGRLSRQALLVATVELAAPAVRMQQALRVWAAPAVPVAAASMGQQVHRAQHRLRVQPVVTVAWAVRVVRRRREPRAVAVQVA